MFVRLTLSINAGLSIEMGGAKILVDAFHEMADEGLSTLNPERKQAVMESPAFKDPQMLFYTHCHKDHYSENMTKEYLAKWPKCVLIGPGTIMPELPESDRRILLREERTVRCGNVLAEFFPLRHAGGDSKKTEHYGCILSCEGVSVLLAGDAEYPSEELTKKVRDRKIDLAVMDFPWVTSRKGLQSLREEIRPLRTLVYHLPCKEDDIFRINSAVEYAAAHGAKGMDIRMITELLQTQEYEL